MQVRAGHLTNTEQKSVFDRNIRTKGDNLEFANHTPQLTRVNSDIDIGTKYHILKERKMSDNPRRPITQGIAARQKYSKSLLNG